MIPHEVAVIADILGKYFGSTQDTEEEAQRFYDIAWEIHDEIF